MNEEQSADLVPEFTHIDADAASRQHTCVQSVVRFRNLPGLALLLGLALSISCNPTAVTVLEATFNNDTVNSPPADGLGNYGVLASFVIPSTTKGIVSLAFQPDFNQEVRFLHIDFMPEGNVRVDDGATRFGQFPKDKNFTVSVKLAITSTTATAEITLFGTGASGSTTVNVDPLLMVPARRFGAVRPFMGFQQPGTFFVKDIIVTRTP